MANKIMDEQMSGYGSQASGSTMTNYEKFLQDTINGLMNGGGGGVGSAGSPTAYMGQARQMLGGLDTSGFDALRKALEGQYATQNEAISNMYNNLLTSLASSQKEAGQQFSKSRQTISENSFERGRELLRSAAARGVGASGLQQLGEVQNRMQTGREVSNVANQFYDTKEKLDQARVQGDQQYATNKKSLSDALTSGLANVQQQELSYKNAYQQQLASLAMSLQQTRQSQLNAQASAGSSRQSQLLGLQGELAKYQDAKNGGGADNTGKMELLSAGNSDTANIRIWADKYTGGDVQKARTQYNAYKDDFQESLKGEVLSKYVTQAKASGKNLTGSGLLDNLKSGVKDGSLSYEDAYEAAKQAFPDTKIKGLDWLSYAPSDVKNLDDYDPIRYYLLRAGIKDPNTQIKKSWR